jgi:hypothetical protein
VLIFVHIPKTAGTSFKSLLNKVYTPSETIVIDSSSWYKDTNYSLLSNRSCLPGAQQIQPSSSIKYIVGHFNADHFINLYPNANYITWVRDPIQRLLSNYNYYLRGGVYYGQMSTEKRAYDILDFETYSTHKLNTNTMCQQLNIPLTKFKFIGIVERYDEEIERFKKLLGLNFINDYNYANVNPEKKNVKESYELTETQKQKLMMLHADDYKLYNDCLKLAGY